MSSFAFCEEKLPSVSIIIVTFNSATTIEDCLDSLASNDHRTSEVIVVDNRSVDDTVRRLQDRTDHQLVTLSENLGFAKACNQGAAIARGKYILMLNPDTLVVDDAIETAAAYLEANPGVGAVGATTLYEDGSINRTCCFAQPTLWGLLSRAIGLSTFFPHSAIFNPEEIGGWDRGSTRDVGAITGCFLLLSRDLFSALDGFDERFFMYSEDTDLSRRIQQFGKRCVHLADAVIIHHGGRSDVEPASKMVKVLTARAQFFRKHWCYPKAQLAVLLIDLMVGLRALGTWTRPRLSPTQPTSKWAAVWEHRSRWRIGDSVRKS